MLCIPPIYLSTVLLFSPVMDELQPMNHCNFARKLSMTDQMLGSRQGNLGLACTQRICQYGQAMTFDLSPYKIRRAVKFTKNLDVRKEILGKR